MSHSIGQRHILEYDVSLLLNENTTLLACMEYWEEQRNDLTTHGYDHRLPLKSMYVSFRLRRIDLDRLVAASM